VCNCTMSVVRSGRLVAVCLAKHMVSESHPILHDIQEINLSYLLLAQRLLRENCAAGMFRLGLDEDVAASLLKLSPAQTVKLAASSSLLCGFRLNDAQLLQALTQDVLGGILQQAHSTILLAQQSTCGVQPAADPAAQPLREAA